MTLNQVRDSQRRRQGEPLPEGGTEAQLRWLEVAGAGGDDGEADAADEDDAGLLLRRAIELVGTRASQQSIRLFLAIKVEGRGVTEVAQTHGLTISGVYKAVDRVLKLLRADYPDCLPPLSEPAPRP